MRPNTSSGVTPASAANPSGSTSVTRNLQAHAVKNDALAAFTGFALPTSNTTYVPNQYFDVCLPHYSRGVVRLVAIATDLQHGLGLFALVLTCPRQFSRLLKYAGKRDLPPKAGPTCALLRDHDKISQARN